MLKVKMMPLTKSFNETVKADLRKSQGFRRALLREAVGCMISGDIETGKSVLRQYINGTVGFIKLGADLGKSPKALMRMFSAAGKSARRSGDTYGALGTSAHYSWRKCRIASKTEP